jgi:predicted XRE-type DNA-binding protein
MNNIDTSITHITSENANIFKDLGFNPREAAKLKIKAELMCQIIKNKPENALEQIKQRRYSFEWEIM